jgi:phosphate-selective porin
VRQAGRLALALLTLTAPVAADSTAGPTRTPPGWKLEAFGIRNAAAGFYLRLSGYLQADFRSFRNWQVGDGGDAAARAPEFEWRRLRIGLKGAWRRMTIDLDYDPAFEQGQRLKSSWLELRAARELQLKGGYTKLPVGAEFMTSVAKTDFVERAVLVTSIDVARDWGGELEGQLGEAVQYLAGVFEGDSSASHKSAGTTAAARVVLKARRLVEIGGSFSAGDVKADSPAPGVATSPKGLEGTSGSGYVFFPGVYVNGRRLRLGADARLQKGPLALWGEFLEAREERRGQGLSLEDLPDVRGRGWSTTLTWLVTGERKARTIRPRHAVFAGPGAVELALRYEGLRFDDVSNHGIELAGSRARNIRPAGIRTFTGGVSWWPTSFLRFQGNVLVERYDDALRAPEPGKRGNYVTLVARAQLHLP